MQVTCFCSVNTTVTTVLAIHHTFIIGAVPIVTVCFYELETDVEQAMVDCHDMAVLTADKVLKQYGLSLEGS